jgi:uncharacterized MAPEG superfamily protein
MTNKIIFYTIFLQTAQVSIKTFSIAFSENNTPKDMYDHHDAVVDYLIDTNPNPFESIPEFTIIKVASE